MAVSLGTIEIAFALNPGFLRERMRHLKLLDSRDLPTDKAFALDLVINPDPQLPFTEETRRQALWNENKLKDFLRPHDIIPAEEAERRERLKQEPSRDEAEARICATQFLAHPPSLLIHPSATAMVKPADRGWISHLELVNDAAESCMRALFNQFILRDRHKGPAKPDAAMEKIQALLSELAWVALLSKVYFAPRWKKVAALQPVSDENEHSLDTLYAALKVLLDRDFMDLVQEQSLSMSDDDVHKLLVRWLTRAKQNHSTLSPNIDVFPSL